MKKADEELVRGNDGSISVCFDLNVWCASLFCLPWHPPDHPRSWAS